MNLEEVRSQLFFIVGCPRSGTSLLQVMLSCHPDMLLPPETGYYSIIYKHLSSSLGELEDPIKFYKALNQVCDFPRIKNLELDLNTIQSKCDSAEMSWETIFLAILATFAEKNKVKRVGEKSPAHVHCLGLLQERYPQAKFIHVIRDPRAVILSLSKVKFGSNDIREMASIQWKSAINIHKKFSALLGPDRYMSVRYEDIVLKPEAIMHLICDFLDLEFSPKILQPEKRDYLGFNQQDYAHMSNTLKPIFHSGIDKWKQDLSTWQIKIIEDVLSDEMQDMGYEKANPTAFYPYLQYTLRVRIANDFLNLRQKYGLKAATYIMIKRLKSLIFSSVQEKPR